ncbi:hypothetical protein IT575_06255 [bacterium]|nr:hypothetical protein [bacterium]
MKRHWLLRAGLALTAMLLGTFSGCSKHKLDFIPADGDLSGPLVPGRSVAWAGDRDYDGINDVSEKRLGTDPDSIDTDADGLTDQYELWGCDGIAIGATGSLSLAQLPDPDGDGIHAALERNEAARHLLSRQATAALDSTRVRVSSPGDDPIENDLDGDYIPTDYELSGFYYEIDPLTGEDWFVKWDGDPQRNYYKTDPTKWSTDADPWSDWEESTKRNLDQRLKKPGDHPCIPAYPKLECVLTGYSVEDARDITTTTGTKTESSWKNSVSTATSSSSGWAIEGSVEASVTIGVGTESQSAVKGKIEVTGKFSGEETTESTTVADTSGLSQEDWEQVTAGDTIETARLLLNLRVSNTGTLPLSESKALFNLKLGEFNISTFLLDLSSTNGFGELPARSLNPVDLVIFNDGRGTEGIPAKRMFLSLLQLQSLHLGAPLTIEPVGFDAQTLVSEFDPDSGRRVNLNIGDWSPYKSAIDTVTARIIIDMGDDPEADELLFDGLPPRRTAEIRCFAYDNTSNYVGSPPVVTLSDALIWGFGAEDTPLGPVVQIAEQRSGQTLTAYLNEYRVGFDAETLDYVKQNLGSIDNIFELPLRPSNPTERVYTFKAPPLVVPEQNIDQTLPRVYAATLETYEQQRIPEYKPLKVTLNPPTYYDPPILVFSNYRYNPIFRPTVRAYVDDVFQVSEVRFKPSPASIGEVMLVADDPGDPLAGLAYTYRLPENYVWTGFESVVALNLDGVESAPFPVQVQEGSHYNEYGVLLSGVSNPPIGGTHTGAESNSLLQDLSQDFTALGLLPGDRVVNTTQNTETVVTAVINENHLAVSAAGWQVVDGTSPSQQGELKFLISDTYSITPQRERFETLGFFTGNSASNLAISSGEYNNLAGDYGFSFSDPAAPRNPPFDFIIHEDWPANANMSKSIEVVNAVGVALIGPAVWESVNYDTVRKASYSSSELVFFVENTSGAYGDSYVYAAKLNNGFYVKFRMKYIAHPGTTPANKARVEVVDYEVYRGI